MIRERALRAVLAVVGALFVLMAYPMVVFIRQEPALSMMMCLYVTLGVFLLLAVRDPSAYRSVILFTAWSSLVHAVWMGYQAMAGMVPRGELIGVACAGGDWSGAAGAGACEGAGRCWPHGPIVRRS